MEGATLTLIALRQPVINFVGVVVVVVSVLPKMTVIKALLYIK